MGVLYPATFVIGYNANPPPPVEPQIIYIEAEQGTPRLGHTDFDPLLMARPLRWSLAWPSGAVARLGRRSRWSLQDLCYPIRVKADEPSFLGIEPAPIRLRDGV
jgi:hypothetical protein